MYGDAGIPMVKQAIPEYAHQIQSYNKAYKSRYVANEGAGEYFPANRGFPVLSEFDEAIYCACYQRKGQCFQKIADVGIKKEILKIHALGKIHNTLLVS